MKTLFFETSGSDYPVARRHVPEEGILKQAVVETSKLTRLRCWSSPSNEFILTWVA